ncbi:MAG: HNH endonuclease [Planctomycetaceae bacterium]|nr:HNH endonuclease [Planctomycetaceae bacterium]
MRAAGSGRRAGTRRRPDRRPTAAARGYGSRWSRYRRTLLSRPENALCGRCRAAGRTRAATDVDHIDPVESAEDPRFWDPDNHQALCHRCHSIKTNTTDRDKGRRKR